MGSVGQVKKNTFTTSWPEEVILLRQNAKWLNCEVWKLIFCHLNNENTCNYHHFKLLVSFLGSKTKILQPLLYFLYSILRTLKLPTHTYILSGMGNCSYIDIFINLMKNDDFWYVTCLVILLHNVTRAGRVILFQMKITSTVLKLEEWFLCQNRSVFNQEFVGRSPDSTRGRTFAK